MSVDTAATRATSRATSTMSDSIPIWALVIIGAATFVVYAAVLRKLVHDWWILPDFSHGFFVPLFSAFVVWQKRKLLTHVQLRPSWTGSIIIMISMLLLICGQVGAELFISRASFLVLIAGLVVLFAGWEWLRAVLFPWAFLLLMIPIPAIIFNQITFPLQLLASKVAAVTLPIFGVPVLREGNVINIPAMSLEVAEACSGIRSLVTLSTLALIYAYVAEDKRWRRVVLVLASIPVAVVANATRVVGTGVCVQYWDPQKALGFFHEFSGWVIFMASFVMLYLIHGALRRVGRGAA